MVNFVYYISDSIMSGGNVERVNGFPVFVLGETVGIIMNYLYTRSDYTYDELARLAIFAIPQIENIANDTIISLPLSKKAAHDTANILRSLISDDFLKNNGKNVLSLEDKNRLTIQINHFRSLFFAELSTCDLYFISPKRAYDMGKLIFKAEENLGKSVIHLLSEQCINEIREAGRCIAFDLPTASAFHIFRAVEIIVLMYFPALGKPNPTDKNLGNYIKLLEKEGINEKVIGMLRHLKDAYRNPIMHPDLLLEDDESQNLFQFALSAISTMIRDINTLKQAPIPQLFSPNSNLPSQLNP